MSEGFSRESNRRRGPGDGGPANIRFDNKDAKIGLLAGVIVGDVHNNNYTVKESAPPAERFETALRLLDGNMARRASEVIQEVVENGFRSNRVAYYWTLFGLERAPVRPGEAR